MIEIDFVYRKWQQQQQRQQFIMKKFKTMLPTISGAILGMGNNTTQGRIQDSF